MVLIVEVVPSVFDGCSGECFWEEVGVVVEFASGDDGGDFFVFVGEVLVFGECIYPVDGLFEGVGAHLFCSELDWISTSAGSPWLFRPLRCALPWGLRSWRTRMLGVLLW